MVRILDGSTIASILTVDLALDAMRRAFALEGAGRAGPADRLDIGHPRGWMRVLPAAFEGLGVFGLKTISMQSGVGVRYAIFVHDLESGALRAVVDAEAITGARTGATAAVAAEHLCRTDIERAAVIGTGSVSRSQVPALQAVRPVEEIRVFSRNPANRSGFIDEMGDLVDARLVDCSTVEEAIEGASLVTLATKAPQPVLGPEHLRPGLHVSSVGAARPNLAELDPDAFDRFDLIVCDSVELVYEQAGDAVAAVERGLDPDRSRTLGSVVAGLHPGRTSPEQLTLFKSTGTGLQDLALAAAILEIADAENLGVEVGETLTVKRFGATGRT
ncbi:MAG: ornithine cyclodeaminase family protein [Acidimicrobiia bacterium]